MDEISHADCIELLRFGTLGRLALDVDGVPAIVPVNYRLVEESHLTWVALRTRVGTILDRDRVPAAFEIDDVDHRTREGWSVLVRGLLSRVDPDAASFATLHDPDPWVPDRDRWLVIEPFTITGRRLHVHHSDVPPPTIFFR